MFLPFGLLKYVRMCVCMCVCVKVLLLVGLWTLKTQYNYYISGVICVGMVFLVEKMGALIQAGKSLAGITAGSLLGLFSLGMFFPWANTTVSIKLEPF